MRAGTSAVKILSGVASSSTALWASFIGNVAADQLLSRTGVPVKQVADYLATVGGQAQTTWFLDIAHGLVYATATATDGQQAQQWLTALRQPALARQGYSVLMQQPSAFGDQLDPWGYQATSLPLMRQLKARWDPKGILPVLW